MKGEYTLFPFGDISELAAIPGDAPLSSPQHAFHSPYHLIRLPRAISRVQHILNPVYDNFYIITTTFALNTRLSNALPTARSTTMPARKRAASEMEVEEITEPPSTLQRLRSMWQFANLAQYIAIFGDAVKIDKDFDIEVSLLCAEVCYEYVEHGF